MGDVGDDFRAWREHKRKMKRKRLNANLRKLRESGERFAYIPDNHACLFRGHKRADFYASTGRWKNLDTGKIHDGGAAAFLTWYQFGKDRSDG